MQGLGNSSSGKSWACEGAAVVSLDSRKEIKDFLKIVYLASGRLVARWCQYAGAGAGRRHDHDWMRLRL